MMFTALLMRPWILLAKSIGACPRILADDILLLVHGAGMIRRFTTGLTLTHQYVLDMGAKIAEGKSLNVVSTITARRWLSATAWDLAGGAIKVVEHLRYLGGHLTTTTKRHHSTLTQRGVVGQHMAGRAGRLPASRKQKAAIIRVKVMSTALYGIEVADFAEREYAKLSTAILAALTINASRKDVDWTFTVASFGSDLDPVVQTLTRRCMALRRAIAKKPHMRGKYQGIYEAYRRCNSAATLQDDYTTSQLSNLKPAPHPTMDSRSIWKQGVKPRGPIGLLLQSIHYLGAALNATFEIVQYNEVPIHIFQTTH